jgi:ribonuclease VapC
MIVVDSSAIIAIFRQEVDAGAFARRIADEPEPAISVANVLECSTVIRTLKMLDVSAAELWLDTQLSAMSLRTHPISVPQLSFARQAHIQFGKGTGHGAGLNFGDCFAYALAKELDVPLLFKGGDFAKTDILSALV